MSLQVQSSNSKPDRQSYYSDSDAEIFTEKPDAQKIAVTHQEETRPKTSSSRSSDDPNIVYPRGFKLVVLMLSLCAVSFSVGLNNTIITTAIPTIAAEFDAIQDVGWYGSAFFLADTSLQPILGKLYTFWAIKKVYMAVLIFFQVGIVLQATAKSSGVFILGRAISGIGSAGLMTGGINIISHLAVKEQRTMYMSFVMCFNIICSSCGPILGGTLTKALSGPRCFFIVLPMPFLGMLCLLLLFKPTYDPERHNLSLKEKIRLFDPIGCFLLTTCVLSLLIALHYGSSNTPWTSAPILAPLIISVVLFTSFVASQKYHSAQNGDVATIPKRVFSRRAIWSSCGLGFCLFLVVNSHQFFLPYFFQAARSYTPVRSGISQVPYFVSFTLSCVAVGVLPGVMGYFNPFMIFGSLLSVVGAALMYTLRLNTPTSKIIGYEILSGAGTGMGGMATIVAVNTVLQEEDQPIGLALVVMFQLLGDAISVSVSNTIFVKSLLSYLGGMSNINAEAILADPLVIRKTVSGDMLPAVLGAFMKSVSNVFLLSVGASVVAVAFACASEWVPVARNKKLAGGEEKKGGAGV